MQRFISRCPSPALVIALLALFVSLGGSAYAVKKLNGKNIKTRSIAGSKLKNDSVTGKQVKEASLSLPQGPAGTALAYAHVNASGEVEAARSKNVPAGSVTQSAGRYCFDLTFTPKNAVVTADSTFTTAVVDTVKVGAPYPFGCPASSEAEVKSFKADDVTGLANGFYIVFN